MAARPEQFFSKGEKAYPVNELLNSTFPGHLSLCAKPSCVGGLMSVVTGVSIVPFTDTYVEESQNMVRFRRPARAGLMLHTTL